MKDIKNFLESKGAVIHDKHLEEDDEDEDTVTEDHNRQGMYTPKEKYWPVCQFMK